VDGLVALYFTGLMFYQESFYSQLKKLSDEDNTNLYVSNLPKDMNEHVSHNARNIASQSFVFGS